MRTIEKKIKHYDKVVTLASVVPMGNYIHYVFVDSSNDEWTHDQIPVESCQSDEAKRQASIWFTKVGKLKIGDKVVVKAAIRQQLGGGVYRNVEKIVMKT